MKLGLKLWSTNDYYIEPAKNLFSQGYYDYIELYAVPSSFDKYINLWKELDIPFILHGAHFKNGMDFSKKECFERNKILVDEAIKFSDELNSEYIVFHPGIEGCADETIRQIKIFNNGKFVIENKPFFGIPDNKNISKICIGATYSEIKKILEETKTFFCLDIGHAIYSANAQKIDPIEFIKKLETLKPVMYHVSDGDSESIYDMHEKIGKGNFPIKKVISILEGGKYILYEAKKNDKILESEREDFASLKKIINKRYE